LSRKAFPKQFIPLIGEQSLLELTLRRAAALSDARSVVCVGADEHRFLVADSANRAAVPIVQLLEPLARNTAAAIALATLAVEPDDTLLICPADHHIPDIQRFADSIRRGLGAAAEGCLVTFGVVPTFPSTAYGYIERGAERHDGGQQVARFIEKPQIDRATQLLADGRYLWNAGIFLARADAWLTALERFAPDILASCRAAMEQATHDGSFVRPARAALEICRAESIDYAVLERADNVVVFPFDGVWSDVGSWNAVAEMGAADAAGNRVSGDTARAVPLLSTETYIHAGGNRPVVTLGTERLLVIDTPDALLVASRDRAEDVKQVVAKLESLDATEAIHHRQVARPWGWYDSVDRGERHQVKRIMVKPGASLSLQLHHHRAEHWIVVRGVAEIVNGDQVITLHENQSTYIPVGCRHRLSNPGQEPLEIIEVQSGDYLGEDDIVRFEDDYGRH
jgi:mannose-1-phosphate guanylyltransferase/mannose-6-phosphate isomerase